MYGRKLHENVSSEVKNDQFGQRTLELCRRYASFPATRDPDIGQYHQPGCYRPSSRVADLLRVGLRLCTYSNSLSNETVCIGREISHAPLPLQYSIMRLQYAVYNWDISSRYFVDSDIARLISLAGRVREE